MANLSKKNNYMKKIVFCYILFNMCINQFWAKDIMLYIHGDKTVDQSYFHRLEKEMQNLNVETINYPIDLNRSIGEHTLRIDSIVRNYREVADSLSIFMIAEKEASFVALDVLAKDTAIVALFALSSAFCNGDDYFYNETSIIKNMEMLDSASFDNSKEQYLKFVYKMTSHAKQGKTYKLPQKADEHMQVLFTLLNSRYGRSLLEFSLDDHLKSVRSKIIPFFQSKNQSSELDLYIGKLIYWGALYGVEYTEPQSYNYEDVSSEIAKHISNLLKH